LLGTLKVLLGHKNGDIATHDSAAKLRAVSDASKHLERERDALPFECHVNPLWWPLHSIADAVTRITRATRWVVTT
jgi:hypothetical protein